MKRPHSCQKLEMAEAWIEDQSGEWLLNINRTATEHDLEENHYLEEVGQIIEHVALNILFCPYCGEEMNQENSNFVPSFTHNDFSKWS